jgi:CBS domain-containing protein
MVRGIGAADPQIRRCATMRVKDALSRKGDLVVTITPDETVTDLLASLARYRVGALVVTQPDGSIIGIVSERDVVRHLHTAGASILDQPVSTIMTTDLRTASPLDDCADLMVMMTDHRIRHVPVVLNDRLVGIISIGDVVKHRIDELQYERDHLTTYLTT